MNLVKLKRFKSQTRFYDCHWWYYRYRVIYIYWFITSYHWSSNVIDFIFIRHNNLFSVTQSLGEMATYIPISGSFAQFVTRWVSKVVVLLMVGYIGFHGLSLLV